jgi:cytochrome c-type biogenesis protein CcmH
MGCFVTPPVLSLLHPFAAARARLHGVQTQSGTKMGFWITSIGIAAVCCAVLVRAVLKARGAQAPAAAYDLQVYRDQLKDMERDLARGVITEEDAERLRTEVSRRILAADAKLRGETPETRAQSKTALLVLSGVTVLALTGGATWLYTQLGAPGYEDLPLETRIAASDAARETRLSQAEREAQFEEVSAEATADPSYLSLVKQLRAAVATRPGDVEGLALLARHEAGLGNFRAAHQAQTALLQAKGPEATGEDFAILADLMVSAARGYVSSDAEKALRAALARSPDEPRARYYLGLYMLQVDRPDAAFRLWRNLLEESTMDDPWTSTILDQIGRVARLAGVQYDLPQIPGLLADPTQEDLDAASQLTAEERAEMIEGMVASLSARLATQGGTSEEWARLIRAHGVLGNLDQASAIWDEAQLAFGNDDAALTILRAAAVDAGVLQ